MIISLDYLYKKYNMNITGVVHVGGHYGEEIPTYYSLGIKNIILFEPVKDSFNILKRYESGNTKVLNYALGDKERDSVTMFLSSNNKESSSLLLPEKHLTQYPHITFNEIEQVSLKRLDSFKKEIKNCNFLNMDVQGYELNVIKGAGDLIKNFDYIYCEVNRDETYKGNALVEEIDEYLINYSFIRVETDWSGNIWGDAFYIKRKLIEDE